jgi:hypothetical protein
LEGGFDLLGSVMLKLMDVQSQLLLVLSFRGDADVYNWLLVCMVLHLAMVISCLACCAVGPKMLLLKRLILCQ